MSHPIHDLAFLVVLLLFGFSCRADRAFGRLAEGAQLPRDSTGFIAIAALAAMVTSLTACASNPVTGGPAFLAGLNSCLKKHGIADPENTRSPSEGERVIPALIGARGMRVPIGATRAQFAGALKRCGAAYVRVAPAPITDQRLKDEISGQVVCLARNGFALPPPNFPGPGPVLDTHEISVGSARWQATAMGCSVTQALTKVTLSACMGKDVLAGPATGAHFEDQLLALPACLKKGGL